MKTRIDNAAPNDSASQGRLLPPNQQPPSHPSGERQQQADTAVYRRLRRPAGTAELAAFDARPGGASGRPRHGLSDAELDRLLASAGAAEAAGRLDAALDALTIAAAEITVRGETSPDLFAWMAQLEAALGQHDAAEQLAALARDLAIEVGNPAVALRMDVLRARNAHAALRLDRAQTPRSTATNRRV